MADFTVIIRDPLRRIPHGALRDGEERIVVTATDVRSRPYFRAALTDEDAARFCEFSRVQLHAKALALGIAYVGCRAASFFMSHNG